MADPFIRPFRSGDEAGVARLCCCTGNSSHDATGMLSDDSIWGDVWVLPYTNRHPHLAWVVELDHKVVGYVVATPDTESFYKWFREEWWPPRRTRTTSVITDKYNKDMESSILTSVDKKGEPKDDALDCSADYPAHLHINILPQAQGRGLGKELIATVLRALRDRGLKGVHLGSSAKNDGATAFYRKIGFEEKPAHPGSRTFAWDLTAVNPWWA